MNPGDGKSQAARWKPLSMLERKERANAMCRAAYIIRELKEPARTIAISALLKGIEGAFPPTSCAEQYAELQKNVEDIFEGKDEEKK